MPPVGLGAIRLPPSPIDGELPYEMRGRLPAALDVDLSGDADPIEPSERTKVETPDGGVVVYIGPPRKKAKRDTEFDDNLAEVIPEPTLGQMADDLLELIEQDNTSRREWLETRARGIELMGLKIEAMRSAGPDGSAPLEGQSQVRATLLAEAVVRFGANAFAELCPTDGPAKVAENPSRTSPELDELADALENDLNHYLLNVDKPYVPDTDAMLLRVGLDGCVFKKVYHDPILKRPVARAVYGEDLIVRNNATSIYDAGRITHRTFMRKSMIRRMQLVGAYRDTALGDPGYPEKSAAEMSVEEISGVRKHESFDRDDRDYEIYECYCEYDIPGFEHETKGKADGLAIPYKVVIHKELRQILDVRRNWVDGDELCLPKTWFVQYCFIRGFGFYGIGLSHLLGNLTNGITAAWREFLDAGMFANFPGLLFAKGAGRQNNNIFRLAPGQGQEVETGGLPIGQVVMGVPYKPPDAISVQFVGQLNQEGKGLGGTAEVMVGEGRQDAPVGTTLALIEQAIKPLLATHKRLCGSQADELQLLVERFREDPEAWVRVSRMQKPVQTPGAAEPSGLTWDEMLFLQAINENRIITRADPNTASHLQRMLRNAALYQMAKDDPGSFNVLRIRQVCIRGIGFADPDQFLNQNPQPPPPDPKAIADQMSAQADMLDAQTKQAQLQHDVQNAPLEAQGRMADNQAKIASARLGLQKEALAAKTQASQAQAIGAKAQGEQMKHVVTQREGAADRAVDLLKQQRDHAHDLQMVGLEGRQEMAMHAADQRQEAALAGQAQAHEAGMARFQQAHDTAAAMRDQAHETGMAREGQMHEAGLAQSQGQRDLAKTQLQGQAQQEIAAQRAQVPGRPTQQRAAGGRIADELDTPYGRARRALDGEYYVKRADGGFLRVRRRARR